GRTEGLQGCALLQSDDHGDGCRRRHQVVRHVRRVWRELGDRQAFHDPGHEVRPDGGRDRPAEDLRVAGPLDGHVAQRYLLGLVTDPDGSRELGREADVPGVEITLVGTGLAACGPADVGPGPGPDRGDLLERLAGDGEYGGVADLGRLRPVLVDRVPGVVDDAIDDVVVGVEPVRGEVRVRRGHLQGRHGRRAQNDGGDRFEVRLGDSHPAGDVDDLVGAYGQGELGENDVGGCVCRRLQADRPPGGASPDPPYVGAVGPARVGAFQIHGAGGGEVVTHREAVLEGRDEAEWLCGRPRVPAALDGEVELVEL